MYLRASTAFCTAAGLPVVRMRQLATYRSEAAPLAPMLDLPPIPPLKPVGLQRKFLYTLWLAPPDADAGCVWRINSHRFADL